MEQLWKNYERLRRNEGLMDSEIAAKAGMTRQQLSRIKLAGNPTVKTLLKLAKAMETKPEAFFSGIVG